MSDEKRLEYIGRIEELRTQVTNRYEILNIEAIWLFVATLSCWSVNVTIIQIIAIMLVLFFFSSKVMKDKKGNTTFQKILFEIESDVKKSNLEDDSKKARLHEIEDVRKNLLSLRSIYRSTPIFILGYAFWLFLWQLLYITFINNSLNKCINTICYIRHSRFLLVYRIKW